LRLGPKLVENTERATPADSQADASYQVEIASPDATRWKSAMIQVASNRVGFRRLCWRWFVGIAMLTAVAGFTWLLTIHVGAPWMAGYVIALGVSAFLYQFARLNGAGVLLWGLAISAIDTGYWTLTIDDEGNSGPFCVLTGLALLVASGIVFLVAAVTDRTRRGRNCAGCNVALFTLIAWFVIVRGITNHIYAEQQVQRTTDSLIALYKLGNEIDAFQARMGRIPKDEKELVAIWGKPLSPLGQHPRISYRRHGEDHYDLLCIFGHFWGRHWDIFGWNVSYDGPHSPRRMRVVPF
jgi:hypothetical protein